MTIKSLCTLAGLLFGILIGSSSVAQNGYRSESDLLKQANKFFDSGDYEKALPLYSQVVSNNPTNSEYNYRLGVCMVEASHDKGSGVRFLEMARKSPQIDPDVEYYLGVSLHHAARFEESITALEKFKRSGTHKEKIQSAEKYILFGQNALEAQSDLSADRNDVTGKTETLISGIATLSLLPEAGKIMKIPTEFEDPNCKGAFECQYFFLSKDGNTLVLSRNMGKDRGYDLFTMSKSVNGQWSEPRTLGPAINTVADEAFPTLSGDGKTLFFSSNGPKSTGGYDIFRADRTPAGDWTEPASMAFPVNSPGDDFNYVISTDRTRAFFTSDRETPSDRYAVYEAAVTRDPRNFFVIEGVFSCKQCINGTTASITILDPETMGAVAHVRSHPGTNIYKLKLYVPADFIYQVEADGFNFVQQLVSLEERGRGKVFQEIILSRDDKAAETMTVINKYDEEIPLAAVTPSVAPQGRDASRPIEESPSATSAHPVSAVTPSNAPQGRDASRPIEESPSSTSTHPVSAVSPSTAPQGRDASRPIEEFPSSTSTHPVSAVTPSNAPQWRDASRPIEESPSATSTHPVSAVTPSVAPQGRDASRPIEESPSATSAQPVSAVTPSNDAKGRDASRPNEKSSSATESPSASTSPEPPSDLKTIPAIDSMSGMPASAFPSLPIPVFRVQVGAFFSTTESDLKVKLKGRIPADSDFIKNAKGYIQVMAGNLPDYESAKSLKEQMIQAGFPGAFVVVFAGEQQEPVTLFVQSEPVDKP